MGKRIVVESGRDRKALVADAGWGQVSIASLFAGVLVAYGAFAVLAGLAAGILQATDAGTDITARWGDLGVAAGLVVAGLLFLAYLFGGYVAGRMARRSGLAHGVGVFVLGVVVVGAVALIVRQASGTQAVVDRLRDLGLPTTRAEWRHVGTVAGLASLAAMLVASALGGLLGERWHARLLARALDPDLGAEAEARRSAELAAAEARVRHTGSQERVDSASLRHRHQEVPAAEQEVPAAEHVAADEHVAAADHRTVEMAGDTETATGVRPAVDPADDAVERRRAEIAADGSARADAEERARFNTPSRR